MTNDGSTADQRKRIWRAIASQLLGATQDYLLYLWRQTVPQPSANYEALQVGRGEHNASLSKRCKGLFASPSGRICGK